MRVVARIFCAVLAALLLVVGVIASIEIGLALLGLSPWLVDMRGWLDNAANEPWSSPGHRLALLLAFGTGLLLLLVAWAPRRPVTLPSGGDASVDGVEVAVRRRQVEDRVGALVRELPYVIDATVTANTDRLEVMADSTRGDEPDVRRSVEATVQSAITKFDLHPETVRVRVRKSPGRAA